jgi:hypothetical protein
MVAAFHKLGSYLYDHFAFIFVKVVIESTEEFAVYGRIPILNT